MTFPQSIALLLLAAGQALPVLGGEPVLWATHAMDRVMRERMPDPSWKPEISAARGEWEAFQLVVNGAPADLKGLNIQSGSLKGPNDALIVAPVVLREQYVSITQSSELAPLPKGDYPDALVPQAFAWQELPAKPCVNQPYWVDVYVPVDARPGDYEGTLTAVLADGRHLSATYTLHVWDFALPRLPTLKSSIFMVWRRIAKVHGFDASESTASSALQHILDDYYDMLVEHRLSPHEVWATYPDGDEPLSDLSFQHMEGALRKHLLQRQAGTLGLPLWPSWPVNDPLGKDREAALDYCARYYHLCEKLGCADRLYKIFGELDEPNSKEAYALVREWGKFFQVLRARRGIKVPLLVTEQPTPEKQEWGSLVGSVDIWSAHVGDVWKDLESAHAPGEIGKRIANGDEVWTYTALVQAPEEWKAAHGNPHALAFGQPPVWLTDYPAINYRLLGWLAPLHHITGFTYWDTSHWPDGHDVWTNNGTYPHDNNSQYNGDGFLIYPGHQDTQGREGPVASIRLKWIRESMDDHDYLQLLANKGFKNVADETTKTFARGFGDWDDNIPALYQARTKVAETIEKLNLRHATSR